MNLEDIISGWNGCVCSGEGGGGDCIGSIITVTLVSTTANGAMGFSATGWDNTLSTNVFYGALLLGDSKYGAEFYAEGVTNTNLDIIMLADAIPTFNATGGTLTVSGDATIDSYDEEYGYSVTVTGDCTLTLS